MEGSDLRKNHPQKYFMKIFCKSLYYIGMGDYWYEETARSRNYKTIYAVWAVVANGFLILNVLNELLANLRTDLTMKEKNDLIQFSMAHPALTAKFLFLILQKKRIKVVFQRLIDGNVSTFRSIKMEKESVKKAIRYFMALCIVTFGTLFLSTIDAFIAHKQTGALFRVEVTLIPSRSQSGVVAAILTFFVEIHWWCLVYNMILVDGISFATLVYLEYKFRLVCLYFNELRVRTERNIKTSTERECAEEYERDFTTGIKLHADALWCARNVQYSLGNIYGAQIIETITLLVICLVKLVTLERNMTFLLANFFYISCLLTLNGAYMMAAGDVTFEASRLSDSIFHSGWDLVKMRKRFRALAVLAIMCSQKPVQMTAFGVITLSHRNLISVIRMSYSFFAVMY